MRVLLRKSPLHKKNFFEWSKTLNSSTARGTSTLKSLLSQAFSAPHVHPRPRKRPPRCTLDCGSKTSESPALRGFVGGLRALATAALYLVLKSNGYKHPENRLKKFEVSLKITSTNLVKKLPSQTLSQTVSHRDFQLLSQTAHVRSHSRKRVHIRLSEKDGTQRLTRRNRGLPSLVHSVVLCCRRYPFYSTTLLYTYISRFSVNPQHQQKRIIRQSCHHKFIPNRFSTSPTTGLRSLSRVKVGTHSALGERSHTTAHTAKHGAFRMGALLAFHTFRKPCVAGV